MEAKVLDYLSKIEGIKTRIKEIHWEEGTISGHELAGDIESMIGSFEDSIAEDFQGVYDVDIKVNELEPIKCEANTLKELINNLYDITVEFYKGLDGDDFIGIRSEFEGFIHYTNVKKYLVKKTLQESKGNTHGVVLRESAIKAMIKSEILEAVKGKMQ